MTTPGPWPTRQQDCCSCLVLFFKHPSSAVQPMALKGGPAARAGRFCHYTCRAYVHVLLQQTVCLWHQMCKYPVTTASGQHNTHGLQACQRRPNAPVSWCSACALACMQADLVVLTSACKPLQLSSSLPCHLCRSYACVSMCKLCCADWCTGCCWQHHVAAGGQTQLRHACKPRTEGPLFYM